jgi:iron complex outermembrane recepter protein
VQAHPWQGTTISAEGSWNRAELTQDLPPGSIAAGAYGLAGYRLPYSIPVSGSFTADQDLVHIAGATGFAGASVNYVGSRQGEFTGDPTIARLEFPAYTTINSHAGVRYEQWLFNLFANNVTDRRGVLGGGNSYSLNNPSGYYVTVIQPRTIGLSVERSF